MVKDKLFLLSISEVEKYLPDDESRICMYNGESCWWWLRSPSDRTNYTAYVYSSGCLDRDGMTVYCPYNAVRPVLHLNLSYLQYLKRTEDGYVMFGKRKWLVLDEETGLLLSKDAVCKRRFSNNNDYELSGIRQFLNTKTIFDFFTVKEQEMIADTVIDGETSYPLSA